MKNMDYPILVLDKEGKVLYGYKKDPGVRVYSLEKPNDLFFRGQLAVHIPGQRRAFFAKLANRDFEIVSVLPVDVIFKEYNVAGCSYIGSVGGKKDMIFHLYVDNNIQTGCKEDDFKIYGVQFLDRKQIKVSCDVTKDISDKYMIFSVGYYVKACDVYGGRYIIYSGKEYISNTYVLKDFQVYYQVKIRLLDLVYRAISETLTENEIDKNLDIVTKLVGLHQMQEKLGPFSIYNILNGYVEVSFPKLERLLNSSSVIREVLSEDCKAVMQFNLALSKVEEVDYLEIPQGLQDIISNLLFKVWKGKSSCHSGVYVFLKENSYIEFLYDKVRFNYWMSEFEKLDFLVEFSRKNSLSTWLTDKQILLWARLLKWFRKDQIKIINLEG